MVVSALAQEKFETDIFKTSAGDLKVTFIGHGTLMFNFEGKVIHVDPYSDLADFNALPKAHLILLTNEHGDHLDLKALSAVRTEKTVVV
ncbi:MAG: MBL fold metallo-hydrolase, partial [Desulfobacterales bacterium]|nr:MBL fold metallo-hydrolase [Desulfobacterales bacterium]